MKIRIFLIDGLCLAREGLRLVIERETDLQVIGETNGATEAAAQVSALKPDLVILALHAADNTHLEASMAALRMAGNCPVLLISAVADYKLTNCALQSGVNGYLLKNHPASELFKAIRAIAAGKSYLSDEVFQATLTDCQKTAALKPLPPKVQLTLREIDVLKLTAEGLRMKDIANTLSISVKTVETHRAHLLKKLGYTGTAELTRHAIRTGLCLA